MPWLIETHLEFAAEQAELAEPVEDELLAVLILLRAHGPHLGRPHADTLVGSKHANMKELRFVAAGGVWRVAYAFDPLRTGILLVAADKGGVGQKRFYKALIAKADRRFDSHLATLAASET